MIFHELEAFNTERAIPYAECLYRLGKTSG